MTTGLGVRPEQRCWQTYHIPNTRNYKVEPRLILFHKFVENCKKKEYTYVSEANLHPSKLDILINCVFINLRAHIIKSFLLLWFL